jgi:AbrB family looped-hinge helix DNA binding protein
MSVSFIARVEKRYRIFIPKSVREVLDINEGDYVQVFIRKVRESEKLTRHP